VVNGTLYGWLSAYASNVRPQFAQNTVGASDPLFISGSGEQMTSGQISKAISSIWRKSGAGEQINCTIVRKTAVSAMHQTHPSVKADLADLMCHRVETATKSYRIVDRERTSVNAARKLCEVMRTESSGDIRHNHDMAGESSNDLNGSKLPVEKESLEDKMKRMENKESSDESDVIPPTTSSLGRVFSSDDLDVIHKHCADVIQSGPVSQSRIRDCLKSTSLLEKFTLSQVMDRIKYEKRKNKK